MYTTTLIDVVLKLNPYEKCVAYNIPNGSQFTVRWFVDDNKISHLYDNINTTIVEKNEKKFGKLARTTGKNSTVLGMNVELIGS